MMRGSSLLCAVLAVALLIGLTSVAAMEADDAVIEVEDQRVKEDEAVERTLEKKDAVIQEKLAEVAQDEHAAIEKEVAAKEEASEEEPAGPALRGLVQDPVSNPLRQQNLCAGINSSYKLIDERATECRRHYFCVFHSGGCRYEPNAREMDADDFFLGPDQSPQFWQFCPECQEAFEAGHAAAVQGMGAGLSDTAVEDRTTSFNPHRAWSVEQTRLPAMPSPSNTMLNQFNAYMANLAADPAPGLKTESYSHNKKAKNFFVLKSSRESDHIDRKFAIEEGATAYFPGIGSQPLPWYYAGSIAGYLSVNPEVKAAVKDHFMYMDLDYAQNVPDKQFHREIELSAQWHYDDATSYSAEAAVGRESGTELMARNSAAQYFITMSALPTQFFFGSPKSVIEVYLASESTDAECPTYDAFMGGIGFTNGYAAPDYEYDKVNCKELINEVIPKLEEACPANFKAEYGGECDYDQFQNQLLQPLINNLVAFSPDFKKLWLAQTGDSTVPGTPAPMGPYRWHFSGLNSTGRPVDRWFMRWVFKTFRHYGFDPKKGTGPDMTD